MWSNAIKYYLYFILINVNIYSQIVSELIPSEQFLNFEKLTVNEGLSQNIVTFVYQDKLGFLWFGTADGLNRFDGIEIKKIRSINGIPKTPIYNFSHLENDDSTFWIGTEYGLMLYNHINNSARMFKLPQNLNSAGNTNVINNITKIDDNTLFFELSGIGLISFNIKLQVFELIYGINSNEIKLFGYIAGIINSEDNVIIITNNNILLYVKNSRKFFVVNNFPDGINANCVYNDTVNNRLLIGSSKGIYTINVSDIGFNNSIDYLNKLIFPIKNGININSEYIFSFHIDKKGIFWIGLENKLIRYDKTRDLIINYSHNPLIPSSILEGNTVGIFEDKNDNLWLMLLNKGLCKIDFKKNKFNSISNLPGFPKQIYDAINYNIHIDKNDKLWLSGKGITYIDFQKNKSIIFPPNLNNYPANVRRIFSLNNSSMIVLENRDSKQFGKNVYIYDNNLNNKKEVLINNKPLRNINNIYLRNNSNNLLCVTKDSIYEINLINNKYVKTNFNFHKNKFTPPIPIVDYITEDKNNNLWLGTNFGLIFIDDSENTFKYYSDTTESTAILPSPTVTSLAFSDDKTLWLGTISGIYKFNLESNTFKGYTENEGLPNNKVWSLLIDNKKRIWASSNLGIMRLEENQNGGINIRNFNIDDGIISNEFIVAASAVDSKGYFYFSSLNGIVYFHPDSIFEKQNNSPIVITDLKYYGISDTSIRGISYLSDFIIPYKNKVFSFQYTALDFSSPGKNVFEYKISGYDEKWINVGKRREIFLTNLDPGKYQLLIKYANSDMVWSVNPLVLNIEIVPPFWMAWWFRILLFFCVIGITGLLIRNYELKKIRKQMEELKRKQAIESERLRISKDMHDEIGSTLTQIAIMSELAARDSADKKDVNIKLLNISDKSREVIDSISEIIWAINPQNDSLDNLVSYIREFSSKFLDTASILIKYNIPDNIPEIKLSSQFKRNIFLIIKEILHNIVKHSEATQTQFDLILNNEFLEIEICDNGKGFDLSSTRKFGNGIKNINKRIEECNSEINIISKINIGTTITIKTKLSNKM